MVSNLAAAQAANAAPDDLGYGRDVTSWDTSRAPIVQGAAPLSLCVCLRLSRRAPADGKYRNRKDSASPPSDGWEVGRQGTTPAPRLTWL